MGERQAVERAGRRSIGGHMDRAADALQDSIPVYLVEAHDYTSVFTSKPPKGSVTSKKDVKASQTYKPKATQTPVEDTVNRKESETLGPTTLTILPSTTVYTGAFALAPVTTEPSRDSGVSMLPLLSSMATTPGAATPTPHGAAPSNALETKGRQGSSQQGAHSTVVIASSAAAVAVLLIGLFVFCKIRRRPRKRNYPTPSLPILQDPFADQAAIGDEESLFGGKERDSGRPETVLWNWTQYSHPSLKKPEPVLASTVEKTMQVEALLPTKRESQTTNEKRASSGLSALSGTPAVQQPQLELPPVRPSDRVSTLSMSVYPASPISVHPGQSVGIALGGSPLTADGTSMLQRSGSKSSQKPKRNRQSVRSSFYDRAPTEVGGSSGLSAYGGAKIPSPAPLTPATLTKSKSVQGRARVKAPYATGTIRASSSVSTYLGRESNPFEDNQYVLPPLSPAMKTDSSREQDTRALASALGLASPTPPSPQPSIYPDDSITRRQSRVAGHQRGPSQMMSPSMDASARLGNLMLSDLASVVSFPSARALAGDQTASAGRLKASRKKTDDRPPRVPSPPPMPSLAQMALAHTNLQDYSDYRSPTYSIYGLYEAERKSRVPGEGGY